jgi:hypothetical protein
MVSSLSSEFLFEGKAYYRGGHLKFKGLNCAKFGLRQAMLKNGEFAVDIAQGA